MPAAAIRPESVNEGIGQSHVKKYATIILARNARDVANIA